MTPAPTDPQRSRPITLAGLRPLVPWLLATWFIAISAMRLVLIAGDGPGFDGRLYRSATVAWLNGRDPWTVVQGGVYFAAPPPSLLPMIPFALLPEPMAIVLLLAACLAASVWAIRRLHAPLWWLAFPPLVDGIWNANVHVLVMPLIVAGLAPVAVMVKIYAGVVPAVRFERRTLVAITAVLLISAPLLPWVRFVNELPTILMQLRLQSGGGQSITALPLPWLVPAVALALVALAFAGRERAAWLAVPVLWPSTQWYYASIAIPALVASPESLVAAAILAAPIGQAPLIAVVALGAIEAVKAMRSGRLGFTRATGRRLSRASTGGDPGRPAHRPERPTP